MARGDPTRRLGYRLTTPAWCLLGLGTMAALVWLGSERDAHIAIALAAFAAVVVDVVLADRAVRTARLAVRSPEEAEAGAPTSWSLQVQGWQRAITIHPQLLPGATDVLVADGRAGTLVWPPFRRGLVPFVVIDVVGAGPLGLARAARRELVSFPDPVQITPPPLEVDIPWPRPRALAFGMTEGAPVGDDLFRTIRPYRYGDERRRIHWKATAHHGELMVRESEGNGIVLIRMIVDLGAEGPGAEQTAGRALWLASEALARGWVVELVTLDAGAELPMVAVLGRPFSTAPRLAPPTVVALPTISEPVRSVRDVRRRLATTAHGSPQIPSGPGWRGRTCRISREGVEWW